jgi:hypothetical protein
MKTHLQTDVVKRFGFHEIKEAIGYYMKNMTAGKVLLQPSLTKAVGSGPPAVVKTAPTQAAGKPMTLYTNGPGHFFYYNAKMTADYCGYPVQVHIVTPDEAATQEIKDKKGPGNFPFLETSDGTVIR